MAALLLMLFPAWGADCLHTAGLDAAEQALFELDLSAAQALLDGVEKEFACGASSGPDLARFWLLTGGLASFKDDSETLTEAFLAARAADEAFWIEALGVDLRAVWSAASPPTTTTTLVLDPEPHGYTVRTDGHIEVPPLELSPGLHLVQVSDDQAAFGRVLRVVEGEDARLSTGLPAKAPTPEPATPVPPETEPDVTLPWYPRALRFAIGLHLDGSIGPSSQVGTHTEPGTRVGPQLEVGLVYAPRNRLWLRATVGGQQLLGGTYVVARESDGGTLAASSLPVAPFLLATVGRELTPRVRVGVLAGAQLPSRIPMRGVVEVRLWKHALHAEARLGANLVGERVATGGEVMSSVRVHPAGSLGISLHL